MSDRTDSAPSREKAAAWVRAAIDEVNRLRAADAQVGQAPETVLVGAGGALDSLGIVNLAVALEGVIERERGSAVGLVGEILGSADPAPFRTVALLVGFVAERVDKQVA